VIVLRRAMSTNEPARLGRGVVTALRGVAVSLHEWAGNEG
jgi:hypothetical protein